MRGDSTNITPGARPSDPWFARLLFLIVQGERGEWRRAAVFVVLIIGGVIAFAIVADSWVPAVVAAVGALTAGGTAIVKRVASKPTDLPREPAPPP